MARDRTAQGGIGGTEASDLPDPVKALFWDVDPGELRWDHHREFIIGRILSSGPWDVIQWLRRREGDAAVRSWIERHEGRGLSPKQLRFWELILGISSERVDEWLKSEGRQVWDRRARP